jgi:drug/metabolite transporter (DMT)-like permease
LASCALGETWGRKVYTYPIDCMETGWILLIARVLILSAVNPLLKAINRDRSPIIINTAFCLISILLISPWAIWQSSNNPNLLDSMPQWFGPGLLSGAIFAAGFFSLGKALGRGDVNLLTPLMSLLFVFVYIEDVLLGYRELGVMPLLGIVLVTIGVSLLSLRHDRPWRQSLHPAFLLNQPGAPEAILFALAISFTRQIDNAVAASAPPVHYAILANLPLVLAGIAIITGRGQLRQAWVQLADRKWMLLASSAVGIANYLTLLLCFDHFAPSVVEPASQIAMVLTVFYGVFLFKEPLHKRWLGALVIVAGSVMVIRS